MTNSVDLSSIEELGYAIVPLLEAVGVGSLGAAAAQYVPTRLDRFWSASRDPDKALRRAVHERVLSALEPPLRRLFPLHRVVLCSLVAKPPKAAYAEVPLHQDWSFVDDSKWVSLNVWCPLQDVDEGNGCLYVVPGSHRSARQPRAAGSPFLFADVEPVLRRHLTSVPMRRDEALVFDHCLIHGSPANVSSDMRVAATAALIPKGAPLLYYHQPWPGADTDAYEVADEVHLLHDPGSAPPGGRLIGSQRIRIATS